MIKSEIKKDRRKKIKKFFIILLILIILSTIGAFIFNILKVNYRALYKTSDELVLEQLLYTDYREIDIKIKMTDIDIKNSPDGVTKLVIYGEKDYITFKEKSDKLFININSKDLITLDLYKYISKIELYLPDGYKNLIRIDNEFGNIRIDGFVNSTFDIKSKYGDILSNNSNFIKIYSKVGDISVEKTTKGRIYSKKSNIKIGQVDDLVIENENGGIDIDNINKFLEIENENGDININNLILEKNSTIINNYGDINIDNTNEIFIKSKTDRGKIVVKNNYKKSNILLNLYNKSGSINVDN